jgi:large subunit ribosomal protein L20
MSRSVNTIASKKKRKKILKLAKGFFGSRSKIYTVAKNAVEKAFQYSYFGRKRKKRDFRKLWIQRINAASRKYKISYSIFIKKLKEKKINLNRKILSDIAMNNSSLFKEIIKKIQ